MRAALAGVLLGVAFIAGCGGSSDGEELADYVERVVKPAANERDAGFHELKGVFDAKRHADDGYTEVAHDLREKVIARLEASHALFAKYQARSPLIKDANRMLADEAEIAVMRMKDLAHA